MKAVPEALSPPDAKRKPGRPAAELLPELPLAPMQVAYDCPGMCELFGMSKPVLYRAIAAGHLPPARKFGGSKRWLGAEVAAALTARMADAGGDA